MRKFFRWHASLSYRQQVSCSILAAIIVATLLLYCLGLGSLLMRRHLIETRSAPPTPAELPTPMGTALPPAATVVVTPLLPRATESP